MKLEEIIKKHLKKAVNEKSENHITDEGTYMVLSNLIQMKNDIDKILSFKNHPDFPKLVTGEHAWAGDHITTSKDDIEEVTNFMEGYMEQRNVQEASNPSQQAAIAVNMKKHLELWSHLCHLWCMPAVIPLHDLCKWVLISCQTWSIIAQTST